MGVLNQSKPYVILVGMEYAAEPNIVLNEALRLADQFPRAEIHAVHAFKSFGEVVLSEMPGMHPEGISYRQARARLDSYIHGIRTKYEATLGHPVCEKMVGHISSDIPAGALETIAKEIEADLIMVGTHEHKGMSRLWHGLTSEQVMRDAPCSVMIVREPEKDEEIEFTHACPRCIEVRQKTGGKNLFCAQHMEKHGARHVYKYTSRPMG